MCETIPLKKLGSLFADTLCCVSIKWLKEYRKYRSSGCDTLSDTASEVCLPPPAVAVINVRSARGDRFLTRVDDAAHEQAGFARTVLHREKERTINVDFQGYP